MLHCFPGWRDHFHRGRYSAITPSQPVLFLLEAQERQSAKEQP
jgi:hypothetical protein